MRNIIKVSLIVLITSSLLYSCSLFEKEFILPSPVATNANQIDVVGFAAQWKKVTGASSYEIDLALDPEFTQFVDGYRAKRVTNLSLDLTNLDPNTTYYYRVRANISNQISKSSNVIEVTTKPLGSPVVYPATEISATGFRVHWKRMPIVSAYLLDVAFDESFTQYIKGYQEREVTAADTHLLISNVSVNKQYFYRVKLKQANSESEYSNVLSVFTTNLVSPEAMPATEIGLSSFAANWKAMPEADSYQIDVSTDPLFGSTIARYTNLNLTDNRLVVLGLEANKKYYYRVRAINSETQSNYSNVITVITQNLDAPIANAATNAESGAFRANWQTVPNAASYLLDVALDTHFSQILPNYNSKPVIGTFADVQALNASTTYYYRVRATGLGAVSQYSNTITVTTDLLPAPIADPVSNHKAFEFTANWQAQTDISVYALDVATDAAFTSFVAGYQDKVVLGTSHQVTGLDFRTKYYYRVRAKRLSKFSAYSNVVEVTACISGTCKLKSIDFTGAYTAYDSQFRSQTYHYDTQNRLIKITHQKKTQLEWLISYHANGDINTVDKYISGALAIRHIYTYTGGVLASVRQENGVGAFIELWKFIYDAQQQRSSWTIYSDEAGATAKFYFGYVRDAEGKVIEIKNASGGTFREYSYEKSLSPLALFNPDLCFFIATNRDLWTREVPAVDFEGNEYRGFLPTYNIKSEKTGSLELFNYDLNDKDIAIKKVAFFAATYLMQDCGF